MNDPRSLRILVMSTLAFTICFAVWSVFSIIGIGIKQQLGLDDTEFGLLIGTPILSGSLIRLALGVWTDRYGGRAIFPLVMLAGAAATFLLSYATSYPMMLLAALGVGIAGGSFAVGIAYVSRWYPKERQGTALGIFGMGNVGAAVTKLLAPLVMVAFGWAMVAQLWAAALFIMAIAFWVTTSDDPVQRARRAGTAEALSLAEQLAPLADVRVWRFAGYYFFVFGGFVALALWLPRFYVGAYHLDVVTAGVLGAAYSIPGSLFRVYGGILSDKIGARRVMYWAFGAGVLCTFLLSYPATDYVVHGIKGDINFSFGLGFVPFTIITFVLGFFMAIGKAAVYRHIPVYYPDHVGPVGGAVGMIGGLGGFVLPIAFGLMNDLTGLWTSCFMLLFLIAVVNLAWMHRSILRTERSTSASNRRFLPELQPQGAVLTEWSPESADFWARTGRRIANRNLWISIPSLLLAFAVWMVWSVVIVNLPAIGFAFSPDQLFWLAALPGLTGALLRGFYAFMVPIFGGRTWTTFSTASLLVPAIGIGLTVQHPETPYTLFLILALLCGLGGGNFASSMANISFFFPKAGKGQALALNAGLGNLGVSVVQFLVPVVITAGIFGAFGGEPQTIVVAGAPQQLWLQNAGFIWVPLILAATVAAWFGMNDIASAKASFADQAVIFKRKHTWILCWLYSGTFGSFIGYSAGFPLLTKVLFPAMNPVAFAFLGPLVGAASRSLSGWMADRWGGARVTIWVFAVMIAAVAGVMFFVGIKDQPNAFWGFLGMFLLLFAASGVGNASTFQMMPAIFATLLQRKAAGRGAEALAAAQRDAAKEGAAVLGFTSAVAAIGAFFIPKSFGSAIAATGGPEAALIGFIVFYVSCLLLTWWYYTRRQAEVRLTGTTETVHPEQSAAATR
ncbi:MFS transporter [Telmatospirillum sp.]|uniref:nitrate/nitrite transporter n=1 Tax=Telmatospirillum sp. TaxID=2079197 RepID=UPI002844DA8D|nr:MFS transporter [Telmatospirillum sp.]MDR3435108.1 MFS transporter [Telmatospirillum sp.]